MNPLSPVDMLLMNYAAGRLCQEESLIVAAAVALNSEARRKVQKFEAMGAKLMCAEDPAQVSASCLSSIMRKIEQKKAEARQAVTHVPEQRVPAPEANHVLEAPDDVIAAYRAEQKHIQGEGGGTDVTVPKNESAEQASMRRVGRVVEIAVAVRGDDMDMDRLAVAVDIIADHGETARPRRLRNRPEIGPDANQRGRRLRRAVGVGRLDECGQRREGGGGGDSSQPAGGQPELQGHGRFSLLGTASRPGPRA